MDREITASIPSPQSLVSELEKTKQENEHLKKAESIKSGCIGFKSQEYLSYKKK